MVCQVPSLEQSLTMTSSPTSGTCENLFYDEVKGLFLVVNGDDDPKDAFGDFYGIHGGKSVGDFGF